MDRIDCDGRISVGLALDACACGSGKVCARFCTFLSGTESCDAGFGLGAPVPVSGAAVVGDTGLLSAVACVLAARASSRSTRGELSLLLGALPGASGDDEGLALVQLFSDWLSTCSVRVLAFPVFFCGALRDRVSSWVCDFVRDAPCKPRRTRSSVLLRRALGGRVGRSASPVDVMARLGRVLNQ